MIRIEQTTKARKKLFPTDEYCINKNGEYIYLTKVELQKIVCDLRLLGIADVVGQSEQLKCDHQPKRFDKKHTSCKNCGKILQMKP